MKTQNDRELLELAAKVGEYDFYEYVENEYRDGRKVTGHYDPLFEICINPLDDDGDALRLAVKLDIEVFQAQEENGPSACAGYWGKPWRRDVSRLFIVEPYTNPANDNSPYAATRRAIVRAAAELAKSKGIES